jgi:WD40 repeat protein
LNSDLTDGRLEGDGNSSAFAPGACNMLRIILVCSVAAFAIHVGLVFGQDAKAKSDTQAAASLIAQLDFANLQMKALPRFVGFGSDTLLVSVRRGEKIGEEKLSAWDFKQGKEAWSFVRKDTNFVRHALSPDGKLLVACDDKTEDRVLGANGIRVWNAEDGKHLFADSTQKRVSKIVFGSTSEEFVSIGAAIQYWRFDAKKGTILRGELVSNEDGASFNGHSFARAAFSSDLKRCATQSGKTGEFCAWDVKTKKQVCTFKGPLKLIYHAAYSPCGKWIVSIEHTMPTRIWDANSGAELKKLDHIGEITSSLAISPNGKWLATGGGTVQLGEVNIWEFSTGKKLISLEVNEGTRFQGRKVRAIAFNQKGDKLAAASEGALHVWTLKETQKDK